MLKNSRIKNVKKSSMLLFVVLLFVLSAFGATASGWYDTGWQYRKEITIDYTKVSAALSDFPVLVDITDSDIAAKAQSDGDDILFTDSSDTKLSHEIEFYNSTTGHLVAWVKVTSLSSSTDTVIYVYYGNSSVGSQEDVTNVWDSDFVMVQHLSETSGTHEDSTSNNKDASPSGGVVQGTSGKISGSDSFDGTDDYLAVTGDLVSGDGNTVSFWEKNMKRSTAGGDQYGCIFDDFSSGGFLWQFGDLDTDFQIGNVAFWSNNLVYAHGGLTDDQWHYYVVTLTGGTITLYEDGTSVATKSVSTTIAADTQNVMIMGRSDGHYAQGLMDELRVSDVARSSDWISTSFANQDDPSGFFSVGPEQTPTGTAPIVSNPNPADEASGVPVSTTQLSFDLTDDDADFMNYTVNTEPDVGSDSDTNVLDGTHSISISGLEPFTAYDWHVYVTDGISEINESYSFTTESLSVFDPSLYGWQYKKQIVIDHTKVSGTLTDFPLLVDITDSNLIAHAMSDGGDILFMDDVGVANKLDHEIELYDDGTGHLVAWVKVPSLSSTTDTILYFYYGKANVVGLENAEGVWDNNYLMVQHLDETSGIHYDSTSNDYDGSTVGGVNQNVAGKINGADYFDGVNDYVSFGDVLDITSGGATWSLWTKLDSVKPHRFIGKGSGGILVQWFYTEPSTYLMEIGNVGDWGGRVGYDYPQDSNWHYLTYLFDNGVNKYKIYVDGSLAATGPVSSLPVDNADSFVVGSGYTHETDKFANSIIDEARVSGVARSSDWILTSYNNQNDPSSFYSLSSESAAGAPVISNIIPADGATGVSVSLTELSFTLSDAQGSPMDYYVTTSPDIGSDSATGVSDGTFNVSVSGLSPITTYTWDISVTDGTSWTNVSYTFTTALTSTFDPSSIGWQYRKQITIDNSKVHGESPLTNFPVLIDITDTNLGAHAMSDGSDILFMDGGGIANKLNHEIEYYNSGSGHLVAWVNIPSLSDTSDTTIFVYYGRADTVGLENVTGVWDNNYLMVQHLEETSGTHYDSTSNDYDGSPAGGTNQDVAGKINGADYFDGINDYVSFGDVLDITSGGATWDFWIKLDEEKVHRIIGKGNTGLLMQWYKMTDPAQLQVGYLGPGEANWPDRAYAQRNQDTNWHYIATLFDDTDNKYKIYFDGQFVAEGVNSTLPADNSDNFVVGSGYTHDSTTKGIIDEFRVSDIARSSGWILTSYNNQNDPSSFYSISSESPAGAPVILNIIPADGAIDVTATISQLSFDLTDYQGDLMDYYVTTSPDIGSGSATGVGDGTYTISLSGVNYDTHYDWYLNVYDGSSWNNQSIEFTTRHAILIQNEIPSDGGVYALLNPLLSVTVDHDSDQLMNISFKTNATGSWQEIYTYRNVGDDTYSARPRNMNQRDITYYWRVEASDVTGDQITKDYSFNMVQFVGDVITPVARSFCCKFAYIGRARETGITYLTTQQADHEGPYGLPEDIPHYAKYDINQGWVETYEFLFNSGNAFHPFWGYYGDEYHFFHGQGSSAGMVADSPTWEGFQSMDFHSVWYSIGSRGDTNPTPSIYSFDNDNAWVISSDEGYHVMKYWPWNKSTGWGSPVSIEATRTTSALDAGQILQINKTTWLLYYAQPSGADIFYVKTTDAGQTWSGPYDPSIPTTTSSCNRVSFAQYGRNYYMFVTEGSLAVIYNSTDGENWANRQVLMSGHIVHHGTLLHQSALISTHAGTGDPSDQYGILTTIPEMMANPGQPTDSYPADLTVFDLGTTQTTLSVTVHGDQVYDVAFYWEDGTYIGEDRLLEGGDVASVTVTGLTDDTSYRWYAVNRGATGKYYGGEPLSTSDESYSDTFRFSIGVSDAPKVTNENPMDSSSFVPVSLSELSFTLTDEQSDLMDYFVTTSPDIGSDSAAGVSDGPYSISVSGLDYGTSYTWYINVTDGTYWTNEIFTFTTEPEPSEWWDNGWLYRKMIIIDHTKVHGESPLTNFPVLIDITDSNLAAKAQADGDDIVLTDYYGTKLNHEIELYDDGSGHLVAWVNVPSLSDIIDTTFYMYYGNPSAPNQENVEAVWDSDYLIVQHLEETTGTHYDSTSNDNDGTQSGGVTQDAVGKIDGADDFDGSDDYVDNGDFVVMTTSGDNIVMVESWIKSDITDYTASQNGIVAKGDEFLVGITDEDDFTIGTYGGNIDDESCGNIDLDWHHMAWIYNEGTNTGYIYQDGSLLCSGALTDDSDDSAYPLFIGKFESTGATSFHFNGVIDEVRVSNIARSAGWINTSYNNQNNPSGFCSVGTEEEGGANIVVLDSPLDETVADWTMNFNFTPKKFSQPILNASLYTNEAGSWEIVETIYSVTADESNTISHTFPNSYPYPEEGTYIWNVEVWNSTDSIFASSNSTVTIDIPPRYQNVGSDTTMPIVNTPVLLSGQGYDGIGLDWAWLATNETGQWKNYTIFETKCCGNGSVSWTATSGSAQRGILYKGKLIDTHGGALTIRNWSTMAVIDKHDIGGWTNVAPAMDYTNEEIVYAACGTNGRLIGYNTTSQTEIWRKTFDAGLAPVRHIETGDLFLDEGHLFVLLSNFTILKLDKTNGSTVGIFVMNHSVDMGDGSKMISLDTENNRIYAVGHLKFHCVNSTDMTEIWHADLPEGNGIGRSAPLIVNETSYSILFGTLYGDEFGVIDWGHVFSFDYNGNMNWNVSIPGGVRAHITYSPKTKYVYVNDFYQYYGSQTNHLYAFNITTGEQIWKITGPRNDHFMRPLTIVGDIGVFHTNNNYGGIGQDYLYLFNINDGSFFGEIPYTGDALCYPVIVSEGKAVTGGSNFLVQFDLGEGELVDSKYLWGDYRNGYVDENALTCYGLDDCSTPKYYNSPIDMNDIADDWVWSNFTWLNNSFPVDTTVAWRIYYNDTYGNIAATDVNTFTIREQTEPIVYNPQPADSATDVLITTSSLDINIESRTGGNFDWTITTSPDIGSCSGSNEYNGTKTCSISGLSYGTIYTWYVNAVDKDSGMWTNVTYTFTTEMEPAAWWNNAWLYRKEIIIDHTKIHGESPLINFPVLIEFTDADVAAHAQDYGDDIVFTDYYTSKLNHEIELYENETGHLIAWVNVPSLSDTTDTILYMYYGNLSATNQENVEATWNSNFVMVQHLEETSGTHHDSTVNNNDGTPQAGINQNAVGKINGADEFDGLDDYINIPADTTLDFSPNDVTLEAWIKTDDYTTDQIVIQHERSKIRIMDNNIKSTWGAPSHVDSSVTPTNGQWYYVAVSYDGSAQSVYIDGVFKNSATYSYESTTGKAVTISHPSSYFFDGIIDEVRLSNVSRSAGWIETCYNSMDDPSTFFSLGSEEQNGGPVCETDADTSGDGNISMPELMAYIGRWKAGEVEMPMVMKAIGFWKVGVGC